MAMDTSSIRFSPGTLEQLRFMAHIRSLEAGKQISWNELVRDVVEKQLLGGEMQSRGERLSAMGTQ